MLRSAEVFHLMHRAKEFGLKADGIGYDLPAVVARSRGVAKQLSGGIGHLMKKNKITVFMGVATIPAKGRVTEVNWRATHINTGSGLEIIPNSVLAGQAFANLSRPAGGHTITVIPQTELDNWKRASAGLSNEWVSDMDKKGFDGTTLLHEAQGLIAKYTK